MASILIVEDEMIVAMDLRDVLVEMGYRVTEVVSSGEEAIEAVTRRRPDLVLMDVMLRGHIDGVTAAKLVRDMFRVPVVVLTAFADDASIQRVKLSEPFGYLLKPFEERELRSAIEVALHKHAQEARLEDSRRELEEIVQVIPDAVAILRNGMIQYVNAAWISMLGYEGPQDLLGRPLEEVLDPTERTRAMDWLRAADAPGTPPRELWYRTRSGQGIALETVPLCLAQARGGPALLLIGRDATSRRRVHARLALTDRLAAVGTIAAGVAHEINNPLSYVMTNLELGVEEAEILQKALERLDATLGGTAGSLGETRPMAMSMRLGALARSLSDALSGASRVASIVKDLVTFARASGERGGTVELPKLLGAMLRLMWYEIRPRARLVEDYGPVPPVDASEDRLGQVFLNLLLNAVQSLPPAPPEQHEVRVVTRTDAEGRAVVEIRDTGSGIAADVLPRIFDPFFTTRPVGSGTGLGLSICHGIVESLGGQIEVESKPQHGSVFRVLLPAACAAEGVVAAHPPPPGRRRRGRVLVVDDEPMLLSLFERLLGTQHDLTTALDARSALERFERGEQFEVVLCDLMMPGMSGMELYQELLRQAPEQAERMIFITGGAFTPSARAFLDRVRNARVMKPFQLRQLVDLIDSKVAEAQS